MDKKDQLKKIVKQISLYTNCAGLDDFILSPEEILEDLSINSLTKEVLSSKYLLFEYIAHVPEGRIVAYKSMKEMENIICGEAGITNSFITYMIPIINGKVEYYNLRYLKDNQWAMFIKKDHLDDFNTNYESITLDWINI